VRHPATGLPRCASEVLIDALRAGSLRRFPDLVCHREAAGHLDAWRVPQAERDAPSSTPGQNPKEGRGIRGRFSSPDLIFFSSPRLP